MGFQRKTYRLVWPEGHELHGLEVRAKGLSIGELEVVAGLRGEAEAGVTDFERLRPMIEIFSGALLSWNYEDYDGAPIPTDVESIRTRADMRDVIPMIMAWVDEVGDIPAPLPKTSGTGQPFPEESIPMDELSASPVS